MTTKLKRKARAPKTTAATPISSNHEMQNSAEILKRLEAEDENASRIKHDAFMTMFAKWLKGRADAASPREDRTDDEAEADTVRDEELARRITTTPATMPFEIWHKFEVLEHYLNYYGEPTTWADNREVVMLAGIKADLLRLLD